MTRARVGSLGLSPPVVTPDARLETAAGPAGFPGTRRARARSRHSTTSHRRARAATRSGHSGPFLTAPGDGGKPRAGVVVAAHERVNDANLELASWLPERHKRLVLLAGTVGARQNEWFTLDDGSLELDGAEPVMRVPRVHNKSRRPKSIPLTAREALLSKEQLLARTAGTSRVFPNDKGAQWHRHRFRDEVWQPAVEAAGYDSLPFHMLRHTGISLMCRAGYRPGG